MIRISIKIWVLANLTLMAIYLFAVGPKAAFWVMPFTLLFSLPALPAMYLLLRALHYIRATVNFYWALLLLGTACAAAFPCLLLNAWVSTADTELSFLIPLSLVSAYAGVMTASSALNELFLKLRYADQD